MTICINTFVNTTGPSFYLQVGNNNGEGNFTVLVRTDMAVPFSLYVGGEDPRRTGKRG